MGAPLLLLYDGQCRFCDAGSARLVRMGRPGAIERVDVYDKAALARHPHAPQDADASTLRLVMPDGRVVSGAEAVNRALATRPLWRMVTWAYYLPVVRQVNDALYRVVARNRFAIMGRTAGASGACETGACGVEQGAGPGRGAGQRPGNRRARALGP